MMLSDVCRLSDGCRVHRELRPQLLEARHAGRRMQYQACMGWSWAAACSVLGRGHIVAASSLQLVYCAPAPRAGH